MTNTDIVGFDQNDVNISYTTEMRRLVFPILLILYQKLITETDIEY